MHLAPGGEGSTDFEGSAPKKRQDLVWSGRWQILTFEGRSRAFQVERTPRAKAGRD